MKSLAASVAKVRTTAEGEQALTLMKIANLRQYVDGDLDGTAVVAELVRSVAESRQQILPKNEQ
ncbi:MAG: hypothetical protein R3F19_15275 [Verrucomicrobiales bacterium]